MKLCISTYSLSRWRRECGKSVEQSLDWIATSGVKAVEFSGLDDRPVADPLRRAEDLRRRCESLGLAIAGYSVGAELLMPAEKQRVVIERLKREVDTAAELGVKNMRHDVTRGFGEDAKGLKGAQSFENALKVIVPAIREVAEYARGKGVKTTLENHGFYMQESRRVQKLIDTVRHKNYGLTLDMGNFLCVNEDPVKAVARLAKYAVIVHVKDFHLKKKADSPGMGWFATPTEIALRGAIVGHGVVDVPAQLRLLKKARYKGYLSLEFEGVEEPTKAITWGLEYLRARMQDLGLN